MYRSFELFSELTDAQLEALMARSVRHALAVGEHLIREREPVGALFLVTQGVVEVRPDAMPNHTLATFGPGDLVGEVSFVDGRPASASVVAVEPATVTALPREAMLEIFEADAALAAALYRGMALILSQRLRTTNAQLQAHARPTGLTDGYAVPSWERININLRWLKNMLRQAERTANRNGGRLEPAEADRIVEAFRHFGDVFDAAINGDRPLSEETANEIGAAVQRELLPYVMSSRLGERVFTKPRGYAGDYLAIDAIYRNAPEGNGRLGPLIDRCLLGSAAAEAVRNRRTFFAQLLADAAREEGEAPVQALCLACGPAREVVDAYQLLEAAPEAAGRLRMTLLDMDMQALSFAADLQREAGLARPAKMVQLNPVSLLLGGPSPELMGQDLIYSCGLIDYLNERMLVRLLNFIHAILRPGGRVVLGNIHAGAPVRAMMDHVLEWKLHYRTPADLDRVLLASAFKRGATAVHYEAERVNFFAECRRS